MAEKSQKVLFLQKIKKQQPNTIASLMLFAPSFRQIYIGYGASPAKKITTIPMCLKLMQRSWGLTSDIPHKDIAILAGKNITLIRDVVFSRNRLRPDVQKI